MSGAYPQPPLDTDDRFTIGLLADFVRVLKEHGYPAPATAVDHAHLSQGLWRTLYRDNQP